MKLLQKYYDAVLMGRLDEATGNVTEGPLDKGLRPRAWDFEGFYDRIGPERIVLYRRDADHLVLRVRGHDLLVGPELHLKICSSRDRKLRVLGVRYQGQCVVELPYDPQEHRPPPLFGYYLKEDFDFALFLLKVSRDRERQSRLFRKGIV